MSRAALHALNKSIEQKRFVPAYYFYGDDDFRKDGTVRALVAAAVDPATRDFNFDQRRGPGLDGASLGALLAAPPMLAERRLIVVREVSGLKKGARAVLEQYLRKPAQDLVVVLVSPAGEKVDSALLKLATGQEFASLDEADVTAWMIEHAREVHGMPLSAAAAELLYATAGSDLVALAAEIDKSASYAGGEIDVAAVEAVVGVRHGETLADLLNAVAQRQAGEALRLAPSVLGQPKSDLVPIIMALGTQLLAIGYASALRRSGVPAQAVEARLWDLLKGTAVFTGEPWGHAVRRWVSAAPLWSVEDVDAGLRVLLAGDRVAKDSRLTTDDQLLGTMVLELSADRQRAAA